MRIHHYIYTVLLLLLASCSHIDEADRLIYVAPADVNRAVLIEDFTGQRCVNCPAATVEIEKLQEQYGRENVIAVGIHSGPFGHRTTMSSPRMPLTTETGDAYYRHWGVESQPGTMVNRTGGIIYDPSQYAAAVHAALQKPTPLTLHISTVTTADGQLTVTIRYGADGKPVSAGWASQRTVYDANGNLIMEAWFDQSGQSAPADGEPYVTLRRTFDEDGRVETERYYNAFGQPEVCSEGYAAIAYAWDENGRIAEVHWFGTDGQPWAKDGQAWVGSRYLRDESGAVTEEICLDADGQPVTNAEGWADIVYQYDESGNVTYQAWFDRSGEPAALQAGYAATTRDYDSFGCVVLERFYDVNGQLTENAAGYAEIYREHDENGRVTRESYADAALQPTAGADTYCERTMEYDPAGRLVRESFYDIDGGLIECAAGWAETVRTYDEAGRLVSEEHLDAAGNPVGNTAGE